MKIRNFWIFYIFYCIKSRSSLFSSLCRNKSVRLGLDEKKTFNKEMKLLSTVLMRGNSLMFTNKNIDFIDDNDGNSDNNEISVIE